MRAKGTIVGFALAIALGATLPAAATATSSALLLDCADGVVDGDFTRGQLREAQGNVPADSSEYGECAQALSAALAKSDNGKKGGQNAVAASVDTGDEGTTDAAADLDGDGTVTPAERKAAKAKRADAKRDRQEIRELASADPVPSLAVDETSGDGGIPTPLLLALIALVVAGGAGGVWYLAQRNESFATALRRFKP